MTATQATYPKINGLRYEATRAVFNFLLKLLTHGIHVEGLENFLTEGPMIMIMNHLSYVDALAFFLVMPRQMHLLAAEKYQSNPLLGTLMRTGGAIFIQRGEVDRHALRQVLAALSDGHALVLAPEGTRSKTGALRAGKTGAAYLATRANVPILPAVVWGSEKVLPSLRRFQRPAAMQVRFGKPFRLPEGRAGTDELQAYTDDIMTTLAAMLPENYRGIYRDHPLVAQKLAGA